MNRQILMGILSIFAVTALVGGVTFALFSSQASNTGNTFGAGTLALEVGVGLTPTPAPAFVINDAKPGDVVTEDIDLFNSGTIDATNVVLSNINVTPTPTAPPNLGDVLTLVLWDDINHDKVIDGGETIYGTAHLTSGAWSDIPVGSLAHNTHHIIGAQITFDSSADSAYQAKGVAFNLNFQANQ